MSYIRKISLLLVAVAIGLMSVPAQGQTTSNCEPPIGTAFIDINNVRATIYNTGGLFWRGGTNVYEIPKGGGNNALFASGIWFGGQRNGQLRLAATRYGPWEFWAGPLNDDGTPPVNCEPYDRVWKVSKDDVTAYETTGTATPDLRDWPTGLGAPTLDADGNAIDLVDQPLASRIDRKINLAAGERPNITGDQMLWWINNDRGNVHNASDTPPIGLEVHGSAFAFNLPGAIGNSTFYRARVFYKGDAPLTNTYMSIFSDPDLGAAFDDYVGSVPEQGLGYVYNADPDDDGAYGTNVPATGYDFFQGPLVDNDGVDNNDDGEVDEPGERLGTSSFMYFVNGGGDTQGDPTTATEYYNFMQARWGTGELVTEGGDGLGFSTNVVQFIYPGKPGEFWSELNIDGQGGANVPADRRFMLSTGPWTMQPGDEQEIVYGIVTSFGGGYLASVDKLLLDDRIAQAAFDLDFDLPEPPAGPQVAVSESDGTVVLEWSYRPTDNNYLDQYFEIDPLADPEDNDYLLEGYNIYQYPSQGAQEGELIAVYDAVNGVTRVIDPDGDLTAFSAFGTDSGIQHHHQISGLTNYKDYFFGVQAYAYNETSPQKVFKGPITTVQATPSRVDARLGGTVLSDDARAAAATAGADFSSAFDAEDPRHVTREGVGQGVVSVKVTNPSALRDATYTVEFHTAEIEGQVEEEPHKRGMTDREFDDIPLVQHAAKSSAATVIAYSIKRDGEVVFDGNAAAAAINAPLPQGPDVVTVDGLSFSISGPSPGVASFDVVSNAAGPITDPPECGAFAFNSSGFPLDCGTPLHDRPNGSRQQVALQDGQGWGIHAGGATRSWQTFKTRVWESRGNSETVLGAYDWELRFTADGGMAYERFGDLSKWPVPFEIWRTGIGTPDDPSDDVRLIPAVLDDDGNRAFTLIDGSDHGISGGSNDPNTDWIYWYMAGDTPGQSDYNDFFSTDPVDETKLTAEIMGRTLLVGWDFGSAPPYPMALPETGTTFRIRTLKPNSPGDVFTFSTDGLGAVSGDAEVAGFALDNIGIVPNPYKGASDYEVSQLVDQVRFTNLPQTATIRVFTLNGTLIRELVKNNSQTMLPWDLTTQDGLPIASGMYLIHVDTELGSKVLKFGVVKKRVQLNNF